MKLFNYIFCVSGLYKLYAHSFQLSYCIFGNFLYIYMYLACTSTFMLESGLVLATNSPSKSQPVALCLCSYFAYFLIFFFYFNPLQSGGLSHAY